SRSTNGSASARGASAGTAARATSVASRTYADVRWARGRPLRRQRSARRRRATHARLDSEREHGENRPGIAGRRGAQRSERYQSEDYMSPFTRREALTMVGSAAAAAVLRFDASAQAPSFPKGAVIRTLFKDYAPEELAGGATLFHEHLSLGPD